jgi:flagellar biosynthesis protein FlhG
MNTILPVASGKGGVGKTVVSANLAYCLARRGKAVVVVDLDLGGSNLHTCLGIKNKHPGIGSYIHRQASSLESLLVETDFPRLYFIPGDALLPDTANLPYFAKQKIIRELGNLVADYVILDLGSGSSYNTVDFFLTSPSGIIVTTPEATALLNAYSFVKASLFRLIHRTFPPRSEERRVIRSFAARRIEGSEASLLDLAAQLQEHSAEAAATVEEQIRRFVPRVVLNMGITARDLSVGARLRVISRRNLNMEVEYIGFLRRDDAVPASLAQRTPVCAAEPTSPFSRSMDMLVQRMLGRPLGESPKLYEGDQDLAELEELSASLQ